MVVGKAARAYPINMLTGPQREIINDRLGGIVSYRKSWLKISPKCRVADPK